MDEDLNLLERRIFLHKVQFECDWAQLRAKIGTKRVTYPVYAGVKFGGDAMPVRRD